jgi:L-alanine-DL-glutamate epimerase-like enolase superfamily enzyme
MERQMKITDVTVQLVQSACGRKWTHVRVHTDEGITGIGEATYFHKERVVGIMAAAHVMGAIPNALIQEMLAPSVIPWRNEVLKHPLVIEDSCLVVPDRPGLGIEFDEEALKPHLVEL